jgi:hypothetical protein
MNHRRIRGIPNVRVRMMKNVRLAVSTLSREVSRLLIPVLAGMILAQSAAHAQDGRHWYDFKIRPIPNVTGRPFGFRFGTSQVVVYRSSSGDGHIWEYLRDQDDRSRYLVTDVTAQVGGAPAAAGDPIGYDDFSGARHIFYRAVDGHIHELYWLPQRGWLQNNPGQEAGGAPGATGDPAGYVFSGQHLFYRAADGHIHELYWNGQWRHRDAFLEIEQDGEGIHPAAAVGSPTAFVVGSDEYVVYRTASGQIYSLRRSNRDGPWGNIWSSTFEAPDVRSGYRYMPVPAAAGDPTGYAFGGAHVFYRAADGYIHELFTDSGTWVQNNPGEEAGGGAPLAAGNPAGYTSPGSPGAQHVVYRAVDGHIHELYWTGSWHQNDPEREAGGARDALQDPTGYWFVYGDTQHVFYLATDGYLHELAWGAYSAAVNP